MARPRKIGAYRGVLVGVVATLIVAALELAGAFRDFELWLLDKRFIYCNRLPPSKTIVHIDITDDSIDRIGRWPWHRRHHADLVRTLAELGAKYTVFDIEFSEPTDPRLPGGDDDPSMLYSAADLIHDDDELAAAIREAGNVFLPISFELQARGRDEAAQQQKAGELLRVNPDIDGRAFAEALGVPAEEGPGLLTRSRLARALREEFGLKTLELARRLEMAPDEVDRYLAGVKRDVARELAAAHLRQVSCDALPELAAAPGPERERFLQSVLGEPAGRAALDVDDLVRAFGRELSARLALCACEKAPAPPDSPSQAGSPRRGIPSRRRRPASGSSPSTPTATASSAARRYTCDTAIV
jgi:hypothetical protein